MKIKFLNQNIVITFYVAEEYYQLSYRKKLNYFSFIASLNKMKNSDKNS